MLLIALICLLLPDSILYGEEASIKYINDDFSAKIPMLGSGFSIWRIIRDITIVAFVGFSFIMLYKKLNDVSFRTIGVIFGGLGLLVVAAIYDQLVDLELFSTVYALPFAVFAFYLILAFIPFIIFLNEVMLKNQLILQERKWQKIINEADLIVVELNRMGNVESANPYFYLLTGYEENEVIGKDWFEFFLPPKEYYKVQGAFVEILEYEFHPKYLNPILTKEKKERMIQWYNIRTHDIQGKINGSLSIGLDITDMENEKVTLKKKLLDTEQIISKIASHH